jgi:carbon-monoxide dehydrogenase large subunit
MTTESIATRFGSGQAVRRVEDDALLRGRGKFTDDVMPQGQLVIQFLRSPYPHARILSIDTGSARDMPGVVAVYTERI